MAKSPILGMLMVLIGAFACAFGSRTASAKAGSLVSEERKIVFTHATRFVSCVRL
jgi:hypothetical protein